MAITFIEGIIRLKRKQLDELERLSDTPAYARLLEAARQKRRRDHERWLVDWLLDPHFGTGCRRLDLMQRSDGLRRLLEQLDRCNAP